MTNTTLIGIAGGSGSGKTTFAKRLQQSFGDEYCSILAQDNYYIDQSAKFDHDGGSVNFDHPDALDFELMAEHLRLLKEGKEINVPIYDFATHSRLKQTLPLPPRKLVLIDGILIFASPEVANLFDVKIFVDCPEELRFERRLRRDVEERGRSPEGVKVQFKNQVKPMHDLFVQPSLSLAQDVVTPDNFEERYQYWLSSLQSS